MNKGVLNQQIFLEKKMKHKHSEVLHAFVDGIECETWYGDKWVKTTDLMDFDHFEKVRIKPQPVIREEYLVFYSGERLNHWCIYICEQDGLSKSTKQFKLTYKDEVLENVEIVK